MAIVYKKVEAAKGKNMTPGQVVEIEVNETPA
jgi:hypothetical protein